MGSDVNTGVSSATFSIHFIGFKFSPVLDLGNERLKVVDGPCNTGETNERGIISPSWVMEELRLKWCNLDKFELLRSDRYGLAIVKGLGITGETDEWGEISTNGGMCG